MTKPYSADLRVRVVEAVDEGATRQEAAERFGVSVSSAVRWHQAWRHEGTIEAKPYGGSRSPLEDHAEEILAVIEEQPDLTLDYYANAQLPDAIPDLVQAALVEAFEKSGAPASVAREADALHADYDLFLDLKDFEVRYAVKDGVPEALVILTARLATAHGRIVAGSTTVTQRAPATANSVAAATQALGQALGAAAAGIVTWAATFPAPAAQTPVR